MDSKLLEADRNNAAIGVVGSSLAGGCACCAVTDEFRAALAQVRANNGTANFLVSSIQSSSAWRHSQNLSNLFDSTKIFGAVVLMPQCFPV